MPNYRPFRNPDPPALVEVWNESLTGRGAARLHHSSALEYQVFSRPYFDPAGLIVAACDGRVVGFAHAGFGPTGDQSGLDYSRGVICMVAVRPDYRRRGIGSELLRRCEKYLQEKGAREILAGGRTPNDPFYQQLYGGSKLPGILVSDTEAAPFFQAQGYEVSGDRVNVLQRSLNKTPRVIDSRFAALRKRYETYADAMRARPTWWRNCQTATLEPLEFTLEQTGKNPAAAAVVTELEGFSARWSKPTVGLLDLFVEPPLRRQGLGRYLMYQILVFLQENCYSLIEAQIDEKNEAAASLFLGLGFHQVDTGRVYRKTVATNDQCPMSNEG